MSKKIERSALINYSVTQMYDLVSDVEAYPDYMIGCADARILERNGNDVRARLELAKAGLHQSFTTRNQLDPPHGIKMELDEGPFKVFHGLWKFEPLDETSCKVSFQLEYEFSSFLVGLAAGPLINSMVEEQVDAVCQRAKVIYGS